ncbi:MAG: alpha-E domain-containing protein, partial [Pseudomonadales bacterium]
LNDVLDKLSALAGKSAENTTRGYGWRLMELGKHIERSRHTARLLRELCVHPGDGATATLAVLLDVTDCTITHRARYRGEPTLLTVLDLLLVDGSNPRSIMHQIDEMAPHMAVMPMEPKDHSISESQRVLLTLQNELTLADIDRLVNKRTKGGNRGQLERQLKRIEQSVLKLSQLITQTYFAHSRDPNNHRLRR